MLYVDTVNESVGWFVKGVVRPEIVIEILLSAPTVNARS